MEADSVQVGRKRSWARREIWVKRITWKRWPGARLCPPTQVPQFATPESRGFICKAADESGKQQTKPEVADGCWVAALANFATSSDSKEYGCIYVIFKCAIWSISLLPCACRGGCGCVAHSSWELWLFSWRVSKTWESSRTKFQREECICCCLHNS